MEHSFQKVVALADAELGAAEVPELVQELARNPSLVRALQVYIAVGRRRLAKPYEAKREEPVPQWLVDAVLNAPLGQADRSRWSFAALPGALVRRLREKYSLPGWSLAAGPAFAAVVALVAAGLLVPNSSHGETLLSMQLQRAIETTESGKDATLLTFRPVLTFQDKTKAYCRQYEIRSDAERSGAYACRDATGHWKVVVQTAPATLAVGPAGEEKLKDAVTKRREGAPLERDQVRKLTGNGWRD